MQSVAIVAVCVGCSIVYGILHDLITTRICLEYFTIGHPPILGGTEDPTLLAFGWGVLATWWAGLFLGLALERAARSGSWPERDLASLRRPIALLLAVMAAGAAVAGGIGWLLASRGVVFLIDPLAHLVPREQHAAFLADLWAHSASYFFAFVGGAVVIARVIFARWAAARRLREAAKTEPPFAT